MAHFGTLRNFRFSTDIDDIRGSDIYGIGDEKLGTVDDVIFDHASGNMQYAVVDTGASRKFMVPADRIMDRPGHNKDFLVNMRREQIEHLPAYDEKIVEDQDQFRDHESRNREQWTDGPILHKEGSTHILTPEPDEMPAATNSGDIDRDLSRDSDRDVIRGIDSNLREFPEANDEEGFDVDGFGYGDVNETAVPVLRSEDHPPSYRESVNGQDVTSNLHRPYPVESGRNPRLQAFEDHLRRNRVDITSSCRSCDVDQDNVDKDKAA